MAAPISDANRLLDVVLRMDAEAFARTFRTGMSPAALMRVIAALPAERLNSLTEQVRNADPRPRRLPESAPRPSPVPMATAIRQARRRAGRSQVAVATALGVKQSSVSQWERGLTQPSTQKLLDLIRVLPGLAQALHIQADQAEERPPGRSATS